MKKIQYVHEVLENVNDDIETTLLEFGQKD